MTSSPSTADIGLRGKVAYSVRLLIEAWRRGPDASYVAGIFRDFTEYDQLLRRYTGISLGHACTFEIGYGARPYRLFALQSMGVDARGIDAEVPILEGHASEYGRALRANGLERASKSLVRHLLLDRRELQLLRQELASRGRVLAFDRSKMAVGDAADARIKAGSLDFIYSEDVFEHIPRPSLVRLTARMAEWLRPHGVALIRPNVFTGIIGGHLLEWSRAAMTSPPPTRRSEPWEHLRKQRFQANTYLNRLGLTDYRDLFSRHFDILDERSRHPELGREYLTREVAKELSDYSEEELFSNQVTFVLRPRPMDAWEPIRKTRDWPSEEIYTLRTGL